MSVNDPLERVSPPSEPKKAAFVPGNLYDRVLSPGAWPFGAIGFGWQQEPGGVGFVVASHVTSVKLLPASVE